MAITLGELELAIRDQGGAAVMNRLKEIDSKGKALGAKPITAKVSAPGAPKAAADIASVGKAATKAQREVKGLTGVLADIRGGVIAGLGIAGGAALGTGIATFLLDTGRAADDAETAMRKLNATAKLTGASLADVQAIAKTASTDLRLGAAASADLTQSVVKLTSRAGELNRSGQFMTAWLDLAAANGLSAAEAMQALETTIIGQDEGLNRLGLSNPQQIYERWAAAAGTTAAKLTEAQKAQAILNEIVTQGGKVSGEYARSQETAAGKSAEFARKAEELKAALGGLLSPLRGVVLGGGASFLSWATDAVRNLDAVLDRLQRFRAQISALSTLPVVGPAFAILRGAVGDPQAKGKAPDVTFRDVTGTPMTPPAPKPTGTGATGGTARDPNATLADRVRALDQIAALGGLTGADLALAVQLQAQLNAQLAAGNLTLERRAAVLQQLETLGGIVPKIDPAQVRDIVGAGPTAAPTTMEVPVELKPVPTFDEAPMQELGLDIGMTIGSALSAGFQQAFNSGSAAEGLKAVGATLLSALGGVFIQVGTTALTGAKFLAKIYKSLSSGNPFALAAAAVGLIAVGAAIQGAASAAVGKATGGAIGGGSSGAGGSLSATYRIADPSIRRAFLPPNARGTNAPPQAMPQGPPITVIGVNSPQGQRLLGESYNQFTRRGGRG